MARVLVTFLGASDPFYVLTNKKTKSEEFCESTFSYAPKRLRSETLAPLKVFFFLSSETMMNRFQLCQVNETI